MVDFTGAVNSLNGHGDTVGSEPHPPLGRHHVCTIAVCIDLDQRDAPSGMARSLPTITRPQAPRQSKLSSNTIRSRSRWRPLATLDTEIVTIAGGHGFRLCHRASRDAPSAHEA